MKKLRHLLIILFFFIPCTNVKAADEPFIDMSLYRYVQEVSDEYGICPEFVCAVIWKESRWKPDAENSGCIGLMQINEKYHQERMEELNITDLYNEKQNILCGIDYLTELFETYEDPYLVLMVYNMGESKALSFYEKDIYSSYAVSITKISHQFEKEWEHMEKVIQMLKEKGIIDIRREGN